jgi:hypothetical protein
MRRANLTCGTKTLYLRSGRIYEIDFLGEAGIPGECQITLRRVIWLCEACTGNITVETWRPPGEQVRPSRRIQKGSGRKNESVPPEAWN